MADRYFVPGGTGNWNSTTNWSATDGGPSGASFPVAGDNAILNANSGSGTLTAAGLPACNNFDCRNFTGTFAGISALTISGSHWWGAGMTLSYTGNITYNGTTAGLTTTSNGKAMPGVLTLNEVGGSRQLQDALTVAGNLIHTAGSLDVNGKVLTCAAYNPNNANTKALTMGGGTLQLTGTGNLIQLSLGNGPALALSASGSTIKVTNTSGTAKTLNSGGKAWGNLWHAGGGVLNVSVSGASFQNLRQAAGASVAWADSGSFSIASLTNEGTLATPCTWASQTPGTRYTLTNTGGAAIIADNISVTDSNVSPGFSWYSGPNFTGSNNVGWVSYFNPRGVSGGLSAPSYPAGVLAAPSYPAGVLSAPSYPVGALAQP